MIVLVTGTSSGIGQANRRAARRCGPHVFAGRLEGLCRASSGRHRAALDVRSDESVAAFVEAALARGGHIDALVNNAAYGLSGSLEETTIDEARSVLDTNLFGAVRTVRAVLPHFRKQGRGRIVNISSGAGFTAEPFAGWYTVSKFAIEGFSRNAVARGASVRRARLARAARVVPHQHRARRGLHRGAGRRLRSVAHARASRRRRLLEGGMPPDRVARCVQRVLHARRPRLRYRVGADVTSSFWSGASCRRDCSTAGAPVLPAAPATRSDEPVTRTRAPRPANRARRTRRARPRPRMRP